MNKPATKDSFYSKNYKKQLAEEARFWGQISKSKRDKLPKKALKNILRFIGLYSSIEENPGVDYRNEMLFNTINVIWGRKELETIFKIASSGKKKRVLELGCGSGWLSIEIARRNKKVQIDAIDIAKDSIKRGKKFYLQHQKDLGKINFIVEDLNRVILKKSNYNVIVVFGALHHVLRLERLLKEIKKSLKPNGYLVAYEDNGLCKRDRDRLAIILYPLLLFKKIIIKKSIRIKSLKKEVERMYEWSEIRKSPFEGVMKGHSIVEPISKNLEIKSIKYIRCMIDGLLRNASMPVLRLFSNPLKILDKFLLSIGVLSEGRTILIVARKNEERLIEKRTLFHKI